MAVHGRGGLVESLSEIVPFSSESFVLRVDLDKLACDTAPKVR
jgi:hypothetical protein